MIYTLPDLLGIHRERFASKSAVIDGNRRITYAELATQAHSYAALLKGLGIGKGDRVAIFLHRSIESVVTFFAVQLVGGVAVFVNEYLKNRQVNYVLNHSEASIVVSESRLLSSIGELVIDKQHVVNLDEISFPGELVCSGTTIGADLALIIYTSGSTGMPKGIMLSHNNLLSGAHIVSDYLRLTEDDITISLLPFNFDYGLNQLLTSVLAGGTLVVQKSMFPADICRTLERENITGMAGVPMLWQQLIQNYSPFAKTRFPSLRYVTNTGGHLPEKVVSMIREFHTNVEIFLMYGLTEAFRSCFLPPDQVGIRPTSIGKAIPNVEILITNASGHPCGVGEIGELVHRGANISLGYWRDSESTDKVFRPHPFGPPTNGYHEVVVYSGDLVKKDQEGYLYYVGRKDAMIKSHGMRVSPQEVEDCIYSSEMVSNVVVFDVESEGLENDIIAAITPKEASDFRIELLRGYCKREMPEYLIPREFWCLSHFPQTSTGKPNRPEIKQAYEVSRARS